MSCPKARGLHKARVNFLLAHPHWRAARRSKALRRHLDRHGYLTPNFADAEMADTQTHVLPRERRGDAIHHCWNLERFSFALGAAALRHYRGRKGRIAISIDGPGRTRAHNTAIQGATDSQHLYYRASDHFKVQIVRWQHETGLTQAQIVALSERYFTAIGNENSGTLHFDSRAGRPGSVRFVTWQGAR